MAQVKEIDSVKSLIRSLSAKTVQRGCTDAEAMAAATKVGDLLQRYALSMDEVEAHEGTCEQRRIPARRPDSGVSGCIVSIANFCGCKVWVSRDGIRAYMMFGYPTDVAMAAYLHAVIERAMLNGMAAWKKENPFVSHVNLRLMSSSFKKGMSMRIRDRLLVMTREREDALHAQQPQQAWVGLAGATGQPRAAVGTGNSLILVKQATVDTAFSALGLNLKTARKAAAGYNKKVFYEGAEAGGKINLSRPITAGDNIGRIAA